MSSAQVVFSHRMEFLFEKFQADLLACYEQLGQTHDLHAPFIPVYVVVPSTGIGRWLSQQLSLRHGVSMNLKFELPGTMLWRVLRTVVPNLPAQSPFDALRTVWPLYEKLCALAQSKEALNRDDLLGLKPFLSKSLDLERYEFAKDLAKQFEIYVSSRADWLEAWSSKRSVDELEEHQSTELWQADLWRSVLMTLPGVSEQSPLEQFRRALVALTPSKRQTLIPAPIMVFGRLELSEQVLEVLALLSEYQTPALKPRFYQLQPCKEYWHDLVSQRTKANITVKQITGHELFEQGHELLVTWGHAHRANQLQLNTRFDEAVNHSQDDTSEQFPASLLGHLQRSFVTLEELPEQSEPDDSLRLWSCHTIRRQVEHLANLLEQRFRTDKHSKPSDVLIVCPKLADFAPYIEAIWPRFDVPFHLAGVSQSAKISQSRTERFLDLLASCRSGLRVESLFEYLRDQHLQSCHGIDEETITLLEKDASAAGMLAGIGDERFSLLTGLDRIILGAALGPTWLEHPQLPQIAPVGAWGAIEVQGLEAVLRLFKLVARWQSDLSEPRSAPKWRQWVMKAWSEFCEPSLRVPSLELPSLAAHDDLRLGFDVVSFAWKDAYAEAVTSVTPQGKVLVVPPGALRAVPYELIVWLGMDEGVFPQSQQAKQWQLTEEKPRLGDRIRRLDERADFLDSVLAARRAFWIIYQGQDARSNETLNPSILVQELLRFLPSDALKAELISLNKELEAPELIRDFEAEANDEAISEALNPERLAEFLLHPTRHFVERRLGVRVAFQDKFEEDMERLSLSAHALRKLSFEASALERDPVLPLNSPRLPDGSLGAQYQRRLQALKQAWDEAFTDEETVSGNRLLVLSPKLEGRLATLARSEEALALLAWVKALSVFSSLDETDQAVAEVHAVTPNEKTLGFSTIRFKREDFPSELCEQKLALLTEFFNEKCALPFFARIGVAMALHGFEKPAASYAGLYDDASNEYAITESQDRYVRYLYGDSLPDLETQVFPLAQELLGSWKGYDKS